MYLDLKKSLWGQIKHKCNFGVSDTTDNSIGMQLVESQEVEKNCERKRGTYEHLNIYQIVDFIVHR